MISAFLKIEGIPGESTIAGYEDQIEVLSFSHGVSQQANLASSTAGGATTTRANHSDFTIMKACDKSTPVLLQRCSAGLTIPKATLTLVRAAGDDMIPYMVYTIAPLLISAVSYSGSSDLPSESVSFNYGKIEWVYTQQKRADGGGGGNTTGSWNLQTGKAQ